MGDPALCERAIRKLRYENATSISAFVDEMEKQRVIGKRIWYDEAEHTIFITKMYACDSGCPQNKTLIGERCQFIIH
jgi:hypothetical protein